MKSADTLGPPLEAFIREHEYCGELDIGVDGDRVRMTCTCGAVIWRIRMVDAAWDAELDLLRGAGSN